MANLYNKFVIPPLTENIVSCLSSIYKNEFIIDNMVEKIARDIGLFNKILLIANSQRYGQGVQTNDLKQAIVRIGIINLTLVLTSEYYTKYTSIEEIGFFNLKQFNLHSSCVSRFAFEIAKIINLPTLHDVTLAAAFHDLGLLARAILHKDIMKNLVEKCTQDKIHFHKAEMELNITSHEIIGADILSEWGLNKNIILLVRNHHTKESVRSSDTDYLEKEFIVLELADILAHRISCGFEGYTRDIRVNMMLIDRLGISKDKIVELIKIVNHSMNSFGF
ncbi:HDOD domain-containing protein [Fluviispira vulneris]|uniref:HDOD domain-containing protein n=1 Tax=Fluviispira vulneris TaxID=2763012 RepID=UPI0016475D2A|nr:HDOD domain-containing protein [Fluviispira vulneris]